MSHVCHDYVVCPLIGGVGEDLGDIGVARYFNVVSSLAHHPQCMTLEWSPEENLAFPMKAQEDSQEVECGVDWISTMRATEEPFR